MCDVIPVKTLSDETLRSCRLLQLRAIKWGYLPELSRTIKPFPYQSPRCPMLPSATEGWFCSGRDLGHG